LAISGLIAVKKTFSSASNNGRSGCRYDHDAVLLTRATSQVRGRSAIANVIIGQLRHGGSYIAAPQLVMQSGRLALIISGAATSVARRGPDGWHYVISRHDL
jgi:hypothetical protein